MQEYPEMQSAKHVRKRQWKTSVDRREGKTMITLKRNSPPSK
jgi:hypothetical protein